MIIKTLVENTSISKDLGSEHGLSLYIEANGRKILFDVGASDSLKTPEVGRGYFRRYLVISTGIMTTAAG